jgi:hypothetical protein
VKLDTYTYTDKGVESLLEAYADAMTDNVKLRELLDEAMILLGRARYDAGDNESMDKENALRAKLSIQNSIKKYQI